MIRPFSARGPGTGRGDCFLSELRIRLLGAPLVELAGDPVQFGRRKALALLAYLAETAESHRREFLATFFWPDLDRKRGLAALRRTLVTLTRNLEDHLEADRSSMGLRHSSDLKVDVRIVGRVVQRYLSGGRVREPDEDALAQLEEAADLYRDDFLAGFSLPDSESFDEWQFSQTERYRRDQGRILEALALGHRRRGRPQRAIEFTQRWLQQDRLAEEVHRLLMELYLDSGERSEALRQYERCRAVLRQELQIEPDDETRGLYERIRSGEAPPRRTERVSAAPVAPSPSRARLRVIPEAATPIVGRQSEVTELTERLSGQNCRLLTLVGPGGIGKTRLALELAQGLDESFADGVCFVPLAAATPKTMLLTIAETLGLALDPKGASEAQLISFLRDRHLLLILDNFEQLVSEAALVSRLLRNCPRLLVVSTSRERLNLKGEWVHSIRGLEVPEVGPDARPPEEYGAVQLFQEAARRTAGDFELTPEVAPWVVRICRQVAGLPLAIELAATWLRVLQVEEIAREIQQNVDFLTSTSPDLPERHRSLRAVFQSSLELLSEPERDLMLALSEFRGGLTREAAEKVAGASLTLLASLLDKSLLSRSGHGRYQTHELIRQFAAEEQQRNAEAREQLQTRHAEYYLRLLTSRAEHFAGEKMRDVLAELSRDADNLRAAWDWALARKRLDLVEESLEAAHEFYQLANRFGEGEEMMGGALEVLSRKEQPLEWARVAARQGRFNNRLGRYRRAQQLLEDSLSVLESLQVPEEIAFTQTALSVVFFHLGEFDRARSLAESSVNRWRGLDQPHGLANALVQYGRTQGFTGEVEHAKQIINEAYQLFEKFQDYNGMARCLNNLANLYYLSGHQEESIRLFQKCLATFTQLGDRRGLAFCFSNLGVVLQDLGKHEEAKRLSLKALGLFREVGYFEADSRTRGHSIPLENCGRACLSLGQYEEAREFFLAALHMATEMRQTPLALNALLGFSRLLIVERRIPKAWEIVRMTSRHPQLSLEGRNQVKELLTELESFPESERPPDNGQLPTLEMGLLVDELLADHELELDALEVR